MYNYTILADVKSVHQALHLRHHKHTGKILAHKHTSYRVLFLLMLAPIAMMVLVDQMEARASDYVVTATVPAVIPSDPAVITSPINNSTVNSPEIRVSGNCPVVNQAVIIAIYADDVLSGSTYCQPDGTFSVPITLTPGSHTLVAKIVTITNDHGTDSQPVIVTYKPLTSQPPNTSSDESPQPSRSGQSPQLNNIDDIGSLLRIMAADTHVVMDSRGHVTWRGTILGGTPPYNVVVEWGDGTTNTYKVNDQAEQAFTHTYAEKQPYVVIVHATDTVGNSAVLYSVAVTYFVQNNLGLNIDTQLPPSLPIVAFIQRYIWQIYIGTFFSLVFLWYIEHGRHLRLQPIVDHKRARYPQKRK